MKKSTLLLLLTVLSAGNVQASPKVGKTIELNKQFATPDLIQELEAFPQPKEGETRIVIYLAPMGPEEAWRDWGNLELRVQKWADIKNCHGLLLPESKITEEGLDGYGYTYFRVETGRVGPSTSRMVCHKQSPGAWAIGAALTISYNPALPVVIYTRDSEAKIVHRIWTTTREFQEFK